MISRINILGIMGKKIIRNPDSSKLNTLAKEKKAEGLEENTLNNNKNLYDKDHKAVENENIALKNEPEYKSDYMQYSENFTNNPNDYQRLNSRDPNFSYQNVEISADLLKLENHSMSNPVSTLDYNGQVPDTYYQQYRHENPPSENPGSSFPVPFQNDPNYYQNLPLNNIQENPNNFPVYDYHPTESLQTYENPINSSDQLIETNNPQPEQNLIIQNNDPFSSITKQFTSKDCVYHYVDTIQKVFNIDEAVTTISDK